MPLPFNRRHVVVDSEITVQSYVVHPQNRGARRPRVADRSSHGNRVIGQFNEAARLSANSMNRDEIDAVGSTLGILIEIQSPPGFLLQLDGIDAARSGIEVRNVRTTGTEDVDESGNVAEIATVFIPERSIGTFLAKLRAYVEEDTAKGFPRYRDLVEKIDAIRAATVRALWTDPEAEFPSEDEINWWEIWLRHTDGAELRSLQTYCERHNLSVGGQKLVFDDRALALVQGTAGQMADLVEAVREVSEFRRPHLDFISIPDLPNIQQADLVDTLIQRTSQPDGEPVWVTLLDTGLNAEHPLIRSFVDHSSLYAFEPAWGTDDHDGHGTEMAGFVLYGDLGHVLGAHGSRSVVCRLESVKVLHPPGFNPNPPEIWGLVSAAAIAAPEADHPSRRRLFFSAVTAIDTAKRGAPTSWSAAIDALAAGRSIDVDDDGIGYLAGGTGARLVVISGGNANYDTSQALHDVSDLAPVQDPAQSWNAITVGGFTNRTHGPEDAHLPYGAQGDLSPHSSTSVTFDPQWPLKPDVVFEAGNVSINEAGDEQPTNQLDLVTLNRDVAAGAFTYSRGTSAASAQVSHLLATVLAEYPTYRKETVRGLVIHCSSWTPKMEEHFRGAHTKGQRTRLVRRYGFGVPDPVKLLRSADDHATLVIESSIRPFSGGSMNEIHFHQLPWPSAILEELGESRVRMRVTLSYFVEPNPGRRGWRGRYRYASHQLRFELRRPGESVADFQKRLNKAALDEHEVKPASPAFSDRWFLGPESRNRGSIHSDIWEGPASELAECGYVCVFPIGGWWKDQPKRDRSQDGANYSLLVTLDVSDYEIDVYSLVSSQPGVNS